MHSEVGNMPARSHSAVLAGRKPGRCEKLYAVEGTRRSGLAIVVSLNRHKGRARVASREPAQGVPTVDLDKLAIRRDQGQT